MDRRYFLKELGAGTVGLSLPHTAMSAKSFKIIGIGNAGCNFVFAASRQGVISDCPGLMPEFICINSGMDVLEEVNAANRAAPGLSPIKSMSLAEPVSAGGRVNQGRAAALRQRDELSAMLVDTDVVFLVAGLGGGTGSGVTPILSRMARHAGTLTVAMVVTPFEFEGEDRNRTADTAISHLKREADLVAYFSNQELMETIGDDTPLEVFFASQNQRIAVCIRSLMDRVCPIS